MNAQERVQYREDVEAENASRAKALEANRALVAEAEARVEAYGTTVAVPVESETPVQNSDAEAVVQPEGQAGQ